jgi:hypothetical protein
MADLNLRGEKAALYLEDLRVGQRFLNGTHGVDEEQNRAYCGRRDLSPAVGPKRATAREPDTALAALKTGKILLTHATPSTEGAVDHLIVPEVRLTRFSSWQALH